MTTTDVEQAATTLADLQDKRSRLFDRAKELARERQEISYSAHTGDERAREALDKCIAEIVSHDHLVASVEAAIVEATHRLDAAQRIVDQAADREAARELQRAYNGFVELSAELDAALGLVVANAQALKAAVDEIHRFGGGAPTGQQFLTFGELAINAALMATPWARGFRHLAPRERRTFAELARGWTGGHAAAKLAERLGEQQTEHAA